MKFFIIEKNHILALRTYLLSNMNYRMDSKLMNKIENIYGNNNCYSNWFTCSSGAIIWNALDIFRHCEIRSASSTRTFSSQEIDEFKFLGVDQIYDFVHFILVFCISVGEEKHTRTRIGNFQCY